MATTGQPMYLPPAGTAPAPAPTVAMQPNAGPRTVMYYPQGTAGVPQGAVIMPVIASQPPKYEYKPNDFLSLSLFTAILCGIFSPLTLIMSIPAVLLSRQSRKSAKAGMINSARKQGMCAAYLSFAAIVVALVVACLATGLVVGLTYNYYPGYYYRNRRY